MQPALLIRLRPLGPWRSGSTDRDARADVLYGSDRLYSAVSLAMQQLGWLDEWLQSTARAPRPAVVLSSLLPYQAETLFAPPPATLWPPAAHLVRAPNPAFLAKLRWDAARFVPLSVIESLATAQPILADQWMPDPESGCLLRRDRPSSSPFRHSTRSTAPVDRITRASAHADTWNCIEFENGSGLWTLARFDDTAAESAWKERVKGALRLLADTGFGARRSSGWGQCAAPEFQDGRWPALLLPKLASRNGNSANGDGRAGFYWMLSIYSPSEADAIDWTSGDYRLATRGGRVQSSAGPGVEKKSARMIVEGSVIASQSQPVGAAIDVAPDGFVHPVYCSGLALALKLPAIDAETQGPVETPADDDAIEPRPCEPAASDQIQVPAPQPESELHAEPEATADEL